MAVDGWLGRLYQNLPYRWMIPKIVYLSLFDPVHFVSLLASGAEDRGLYVACLLGA